MKLHRLIIPAAVLLAVMAAGAHSQFLRGDVTGREVRSENDVVVTYNFAGAAGQEYDVALFLVWGPSGRVKLERVRGDVGENVAPGIGKVIHWDMRGELPNPIEGMEYAFELEIRPLAVGWPWYYYAGGAVLAGGITYAIVRKGEENVTPTVITPTIPLPPGGTR